MSDNIKVVVKVRPLISREIEDKLSYKWRVKNNTLHQVDHTGKEIAPSFTFDKVYDKDALTKDVYEDIAKPIVEAAAAGFNGTIFAYGQTSSGKTYTMSGTEHSPGIIQLAVLDLFNKIKSSPGRDFLVRVLYIEIYNEIVRDLLDSNKKPVKVHETLQGLKVDATETVTASSDEVFEIMKKGDANREVGATNMNEESSRSHSIFQIIIESREHIEGEEDGGCVNVSQLNLVDLAGSERSGQTGATGVRFKEGTHINKSLMSLALVIKRLSEDPNGYANYRDSKLTRILQNSLGGNAKTSIICAVTPAVVEETISTLQFANRAKTIKNKPEVNAVSNSDSMIQSLTKQLCRLQTELESKKNVEKCNNQLTKQIANLQRLILNSFSNVSDMDGKRRKTWCAPRRATISSLDVNRELLPPIPKYCTPVLKYNPMVTPGSVGFIPIKSDSRLQSVPEETIAGHVTPLNKKHVGFSDEVIEIDSDDDEDKSTTGTCSPYHKCYDNSKTPPCLLRKNAEQAEKNLQDILVLTKREKIYTPNVVELMEKLDNKTSLISRLEDEITTFKVIQEEKDAEIHQLKEMKRKTDEEIKQIMTTKDELELKCKDYNTKLTDLEVIYDTLKMKSKLREEDLLSLLSEQKNVQNPAAMIQVGKTLSRTIDKELNNFMDMSKDLSLVNSDAENSIVNTNEDEVSTQPQNKIIEMDNQLATKNKIIHDLETNILEQKRRITELEINNKDLQNLVNISKVNFDHMQSENLSLQSTIKTLDSALKARTESLESADNDIKSYNSLVQELQLKLTEKDKLKTFPINDSILETMIANEKQFIANNENMENIIHSFRLLLESRNEEIDSLKKSIDSLASTTDNDSAKQLKSKENEIYILTVEVQNLKKQINEHMENKSKLINENNKLLDVERQLTDKFHDSQNKFKELEKKYLDKSEYTNTLTTDGEQLTIALNKSNNEISRLENINEELKNQVIEFSQLTDKFHDSQNNLKELEKKYLDKSEYTDTLITDGEQLTIALNKSNNEISKLENINEELKNQVTEFSLKIQNLEMDLISKDNVIASLTVQANETENNLLAVKLATNKTLAILSILTGEIHEIPDVFENFASISNMLIKHLDNLENSVMEIKYQKESAIQQNITSQETYKNELEALKSQMKEMSIANHQLTIDYHEVMDKLNNKNREYIDLKIELKNACENKEHLSEEVLSYKNSLSILKESQTNLLLLHKENESFDIILNEKQQEVEKISSDLRETKQQLKEKHLELINAQREKDETITYRDQILNDLLKQVSLMSGDHMEDRSFEFSSFELIYREIIILLDKVQNNICNHEKNSYDIQTAHSQIAKLTDENSNLNKQLSEVKTQNHKLILEIENIMLMNSDSKKSLKRTKYLLKSLQEELSNKSKELNAIKVKATELKGRFESYDNVTKIQLQELSKDNIYLKHLCTESQKNVSEHFEALYNKETDLCKDVCTIEDPIKINSPKSLLMLCCNKIVDAIQPNDDDSQESMSNSNESVESNCHCEKLTFDLHRAHEENKKLKDILEQLDLANRRLIQDQDDIRREMQLFMDTAAELQKRIINHRTHLHTLTATTFTENKLLNSKVKVLQYHHNRFHNVSQRDIPVIKKQLHDLMTLMKNDTTVVDKQMVTCKRYSLPDVLDKNPTVNSNYKNESILDGDLLMLDTNITLTTADNTLTGNDQTCIDLNQIDLDIETGYHNSDVNQSVYIPSVINSQIEDSALDGQKMIEKIQVLTEENILLRDQLFKNSNIVKTDAQTTPIKLDTKLSEKLCEKCNDNIERIAHLSQELSDMRAQKEEIEFKYKNLTLEMPSTEMLVKKITALRIDYDNKVQEIDKLSTTLNKKNNELKMIQEENDILSTQIFEAVSESDNFQKELDLLKDINRNLAEKCTKLEQTEANTMMGCLNCKKKEEVLLALQNKMKITTVHSNLNRSHSDSDSSSRYNKICTLQNELHASKEDCKKLTEEVATMKDHLERSNLSMAMELDDSIVESNIFAFTTDFGDPNSSKTKQHGICNILEEQTVENIYSLEKMDCFNYYIEVTNSVKENLNENLKVIDIMKLLHDNLITKHNEETENLLNKLRDFEEYKLHTQEQINELKNMNSTIYEELKLKENSIKDLETLSQIKNNILLMNDTISNINHEDSSKYVIIFQQEFLEILDSKFNFSSKCVFDVIIKNVAIKYQKDLNELMDQYSSLQEHVENVTAELKSVNDSLAQMKNQMSDRENEYNLLKAQKEKVHEISNAVTLDIIRREQELKDTMSYIYKKFMECNLLQSDDIDLLLPVCTNLNIIFDRLFAHIDNLNNIEVQKEIDKLKLDVTNLKALIDEKDNELSSLREQTKSIMEKSSTLSSNLVEKENQFQSHITMYNELNEIYEQKVQENNTNITLIEDLTQEVIILKEILLQKESSLESLNEDIKLKTLDESLKQNKITELLKSVSEQEEELDKLKLVNKMLTEEKEKYSTELDNAKETITQNNIELEKLTSDVMILTESVKENMSVIARLKDEKNNMTEILQSVRDLEKELDTLKLTNKTLTEEKETYTSELDKAKETITQNNIELEKLTSDVMILTESVKENMSVIARLKDEKNNMTEILQAVRDLEKELDTLKLTNKILTEEKETYTSELHKAKETITQNKLDLEKMTFDTMILTESVKENMSVIETLKQEAKSLLQENIAIKQELEEKSRSCSRLEINIKTHEKTAEIQSGMITRLQKQKDENTKLISEKDKLLEDIQQECERLKSHIKTLNGELNDLKTLKDTMESRVKELETEVEGNKQRSSLEAVAVNTRRRRQSLHDSKRLFGAEDGFDDANKVEAVFTLRSKPDDLFMDVDEANCSNRSSPIRLSKGRDSLSRQDQEEEGGSRPSSVMQATRRRRQSIHDLHRSVTPALRPTTPDIHDLSTSNARQDVSNKSTDDNVDKLKEMVASLNQELEEWKEKYKEVDEECETCAQYLAERDQQCMKLFREKTDLEKHIAVLNEKLEKCGHLDNSGTSQSKRSVTHVGINTDQDWSNLHSVVVDRMSYDAEVEKNKKLTKTLEEFRQKNRELKTTVAKMQKTLENGSKENVPVNKEPVVKVKEPDLCKQELAELKRQYKKVNEERETYIEKLHKRDQEILHLKVTKLSLKKEVMELSEKLQQCGNLEVCEVTASKRIVAHVAINTDEDWSNLHSVVVDRMSYDAEVEKNKKLTKVFEEYRQKNRELKTTVAKMQKTLEMGGKATVPTNKEWEDTLKELEEWKQRYKELDEECETCAEYLRERDEQIRHLKETQRALQARLQENQGDSPSVSQTVRKKRQSIHDQNREVQPDASSEMSKDNQDTNNSRLTSEEKNSQEVQHLKKSIERLSMQKTSLEQQMLSMSAVSKLPQPTMYVATGSAIVQNQQLSDLIKENQKLKKINAKLINVCKKRGKSIGENRENQDPAETGCD